MDGVTASFNTINGSVLSSRPDVSGRPLKDETISFHLNQGDLIALSKTPVLEFRMSGPGGTIRRCASAEQFKYLGDFIGVAARYEPTHLVKETPPALQ